MDPTLIGAIIGGIIGLVIALVMMLVMKKKGGKVPRFSQFVPYSGDYGQMMERINNLLKQNNFYPHEYNDEKGVYQKGTGFATAKKFIKIEPQADGILVEAFVSIYKTESGLKGFTGAIPKRTCKKVAGQIIKLIQNG